MNIGSIAWGRICLVLAAAYAGLRLVDPLQRWAAYDVGGDRVEHAAVTFALSLAGLVAFPRLPVWAPAVGLAAVGIAVEGIQALPQVIGDAQPGDVVANTIGAAAACLAAWVGGGRRTR